MPTFNNGESGASVREKLNEALNKVDGVNPFDNDIEVQGGVTATEATFSDIVSVTGTVDDLTVDEATLKAIAESKSETAVDVFVYDTSLDSDGGAWRHRCQHTSWYNEPLNTATRGGRREFPAVAVIVAESDRVTIYDGDDPSLPMWMVFTRINNFIFRRESIGGLAAYNSVISWSINNGVVDVANGLVLANFNLDSYERVSDNNSGFADGGISPFPLSGRNIGDNPNNIPSGREGLVSNLINDVAMTVLPDAPIDEATGLPVPTIAVGTDGNSTYSTSIITDSGDVYDIASDNTGTAVSVAFDGVSLSVVRSDGTVYVWDNAGSITADGVSPDATYSASSTPALLGTVSKVAA